MEIVRIERGQMEDLVHIYLNHLDNDRVNSSAENPDVQNLAKKYNLIASSNLGFTLYTESEDVAFRICVPDSSIDVYEEHKIIAEEATKLILGESLEAAVLDFKKSK